MRLGAGQGDFRLASRAALAASRLAVNSIIHPDAGFGSGFGGLVGLAGPTPPARPDGAGGADGSDAAGFSTGLGSSFGGLPITSSRPDRSHPRQ
jgi:hypothetical protein